MCVHACMCVCAYVHTYNHNLWQLMEYPPTTCRGDIIPLADKDYDYKSVIQMYISITPHSQAMEFFQPGQSHIHMNVQEEAMTKNAEYILRYIINSFSNYSYFNSHFHSLRQV